jgi:hypothetical protein
VTKVFCLSYNRILCSVIMLDTVFAVSKLLYIAIAAMGTPDPGDTERYNVKLEGQS